MGAEEREMGLGLMSGIDCAETVCHAQKHHYDECVARVTGAEEKGEDPKEDCVEECKFPNHPLAAPPDHPERRDIPQLPQNQLADPRLI